ncbi:MAG TPA: M20 family metallopeptidase [Solirubrobacteraceae bacterium]|jgi:amidohydrolase|nr:M20 family metallopeptidase [Solirubrobacteraceae bacterium]
MLTALLDALEGEMDEAVALRRRLHERPELAHAEKWTSEAIAAALPVAHEPVAGTGLLARVSGPGRAVAVRAELDGLPVREMTGAPFSAKGEAMHACGHDVHMAALVALTRAASRVGDLPAPLLAIFQPSEEAYPSGAKIIAEQIPALLDPLAVIGAHIHPELGWGTVAIDAGPVNASCDAIEIEMIGEPSHGAYPHLGRDPILALSETVVSLHAAVGRRVNPLHAATLTIGVLEGGSAENVIPARARARGALRAHSEEDRATLRELAGEVVAGVAAAHGCKGEMRLTPGEPVLRNDEAIATTTRGLLGEAGLAAAPEPWRSCGSDDFSFFGERRPIAMAFVGLDGAPGFHARPLHHPELLPPDEAVAVVARTQAALYVAATQALSAAVREDVRR